MSKRGRFPHNEPIPTEERIDLDLDMLYDGSSERNGSEHVTGTDGMPWHVRVKESFRILYKDTMLDTVSELVYRVLALCLVAFVARIAEQMFRIWMHVIHGR